MMEGLESFLDTDELSLDSLQDPVDTAPIVNKASNRNLAAHLAMIDESGNAINTYRQINAELDSASQSIMADEMIGQLKDEDVRLSANGLSDFLINPDYSDDTKAQVARDFLDKESARYNIRNKVAEKNLAEPNLDEDMEQEGVRLDAAKWINDINRYKREEQALMNAEIAKNDVTTANAYMDVVQVLAPYMESAMIGKLVGDFEATQAAGEDASGFAADAMILLGSAKNRLVEALKQLPVDERHKVKMALTEMIRNNSSIVLADENDFAKTNMLNTFINEDYGTGEKWVDNITSILDMTVLGGSAVRMLRSGKSAGRTKKAMQGEYVPAEPVEPTMKAPGKEARPVNTYEGEYYEVDEALSLSSNKVIRSNVQPTSVAENIKDVNPEKAAKIHAAVVADTTGEAAEALYGTTRTEAVASDLAPQIGNTIDKVDYKPGRIAETSDKMLSPSDDIKEFMDTRGFIWASDTEKEVARAQAWNDFRNVKGITFRTNMSSLKIDTDTGAVFNGIYGPDNGGYRNAVEGVNHVLYALRDYGVTPRDVTVLERTPKGYKPVPSTEVEKRPEGDYVVQVKYNWELKPLDITSPEQWTMKRNLFDSFAGSMAARKVAGTVTRILFDPASILDPRMMKSAYVAVDRASTLEKVLLDKGEAFADAYKALPADRQGGVMDYLKEANYKGLKFNVTNLKARGFTDTEIEVVRKWRNAWDEMYWLENKDMAQTLTNQGYRMLIDPVKGDRLLGKPVAKQRLKDIDTKDLIYDPVAQITSSRSLADLQAAYAKGHRVLTLRQPIIENGKAVRYVLSREESGSSYTRAISGHDQVLPYREGYYKVAYKQPQFVIERVKDAKGNIVYEKAVSVAGTRADAIIEGERLARVNGKAFDKMGTVKTAEYYVRGDAKGDEINSLNFDVYSSTGRSSQRYRGQRLNEANAPSYNGADHAHIANPAEAIVAAARNISRRVPMREWLDAMKDRFMKQYKDLLARDQYGRLSFPSSLDGIQKKGRGTDKDIRDARTAWAYIDEMESGYVNTIDDAYKALLNGLGNKLGETGFGKLEKGVRVLEGSRGPIEFSKNVAFHAYLVGHPLRQALIQAHQAMLYVPVNPSYAAKNMVKDISGTLLYLHGITDAATAAKITGRSVTDFSDMVRDLNNSGLIASIDKQNLVRSSLSSMSDEMNKIGPLRAMGTLATVARKVGFDLGESINMAAAFNVYRDLAIKEGKQLTPAVLADIAAKARNISLGMNRAGDMPYNQTSLGLFFQFIQAPHKMMTLVTTNRLLARSERIKLGAYALALWTLPAGTMYKLLDGMDVMPENEEAKRLVVEGTEAYLFNHLVGALTGSDTRLDLSSLSPLDPYGLGEFTTSMFSEGITDILLKSPAGALFFGSNPRITDSFRTTAQWLTGDDSYSADQKEYSDVIKGFASIASGFDSGFKAAYMFEHGKRMSYNGAEGAPVDNVAAVAQLFGFQTMQDAERTYLKEKTFKANERLKKDVKAYYDLLKRSFADEGLSNKDQRFIKKVLHSASDVLEKEHGIAARKELSEMFQWDLKNGDHAVVLKMLKQSGLKGQDEIRRDLKLIDSWDAEKRQRYFDSLDNLDKTAEEEK